MATDNSSKVEMLVMYKECMHNHAASNRDFLLDGCGLFEAPIGTTTGFREDMLCAVCGCHRNFHRRIEVEIPPRHRSSSIRHHQQQQQPASHPDQPQQPALHLHQPQQPASHHHRGGRGTMIIRRAPAPAPGRFAPKHAAARRQRRALPHQAQEVPPQHGVRSPRRKRITRAQSEMVRAYTGEKEKLHLSTQAKKKSCNRSTPHAERN